MEMDAEFNLRRKEEKIKETGERVSVL